MSPALYNGAAMDAHPGLPRVTMPSRRLIGANALAYVPAAATDIRATLKRAADELAADAYWRHETMSGSAAEF